MKTSIKINHVKIGVCGLSCRLCPAYHRETKSKCEGCKSDYRMGAACAFQNCALKKKAVEFCWLCETNEMCERWRKHRDFSKSHDTATCYQKLEDDICFIQRNGIEEFEKQQKTREKLLKAILAEFNEGRSKTLYCVAATVLEIGELEKLLNEARVKTKRLGIKEKSEEMHSLLNELANKTNYWLKLRK